MPYIAMEERPAIDEKVDALAEEIAEAVGRAANNETEVSVYYRSSFVSIGRVVLQLAREKGVAKSPDAAVHLALEIFGGSPSACRSSAWLGRLNYALTRLIQEVPRKMVEKGFWKEEFRYWVYAQTVGALVRSAADFSGDDWQTDGLVGVLTDVKDEYKRRVNAAYETFQIRKTGDCYTTRFRTEPSEVKDAAGTVIGYTDVMKDLGRA